MPDETPALVPLPEQPEDRSWPTEAWARSEPRVHDPDRFQALGDEVFALEGDQGVTYALLVIQQGAIVYERYDAGANPMYLQYSWSMAKSVTQALTGVLVGQGRLDVHAPAAVPEWRDDSRGTITLHHLLTMTSGLSFNEDYVDGTVSDVIPMLIGEGRHDTGAFAAAMPLVHEPGTVWSYSSGTTNIICRILRDVVGNGPTGMLRFMSEELFEPIGMRSPTPRFDGAGTFVGSSFLLATPEDFARFGYLYLRNGMWAGRRVLPPGWVDYARTPVHNDGDAAYGAHWWIRPDRTDWFYCAGYDGQRILVLPTKDALIVRLGRTPETEVDYVWDRVHAMADQLPDL